MQAVENYVQYRKDKTEEGLQFQDFATDILKSYGINLNCYSSRKYQFTKGESSSGIECKLDNMLSKTGNLYIEYAEKGPKSVVYKPSGIERDDNTWLYVIGNYDVIFLIPKKYLIQWKTSLKTLKHIETPTSKGYLLPIFYAEKYAAHVIQINETYKKHII